jgi:hypothetical protein
VPDETDEVPDYVGVLQEMCADFALFQRRENYALKPQVRNQAKVMLVCGLNSHAHYLVGRCLPLLAESPIAVVPIVRSVFECGVQRPLRAPRNLRRSVVPLTRRLICTATTDFCVGTHMQVLIWPMSGSYLTALWRLMAYGSATSPKSSCLSHPSDDLPIKGWAGHLGLLTILSPSRRDQISLTASSAVRSSPRG